MSDNKLGCFIFIGVAVVAIGGGVLFKIFAPQSGFRSRLGGEPVQLATPSDCKNIITLGRTENGTKYIVYETNNNEIKMKEYSDYGVFEAEYFVKKPIPVKE